jgi:hypothetical protein
MWDDVRDFAVDDLRADRERRPNHAHAYNWTRPVNLIRRTDAV